MLYGFKVMLALELQLVSSQIHRSLQQLAGQTIKYIHAKLSKIMRLSIVDSNSGYIRSVEYGSGREGRDGSRSATRVRNLVDLHVMRVSYCASHIGKGQCS